MFKTSHSALRISAALLGSLVLVSLVATLGMRSRAAETASTDVYICRPAAASETSNARMTAGSESSLVCHLVSMRLRMTDGSMRTIGRVTATSRPGPAIGKSLTPDQVNDAWIKWLDEMFHVAHTS